MVRARAMTAAEVTDFLNRHFDAATRVTEFNLAAAALVYSQPVTPSVFAIHIPGLIPADGIKYQDDKYGTVVIFPDARAVLRFTATSNLADNVGNPINPGGIVDAIGNALPHLPSLTTIFIILALVGGAVVLADRKL